MSTRFRLRMRPEAPRSSWMPVLAAALIVTCTALVGARPALAGNTVMLGITTQTTLTNGSGGGPDTFFDTATLSGAPSNLPTPTGTVTFNVYGPIIYPSTPSSTSCAGTPTYTSTNPLNTEGTSVSSNTFAPVGAAPRPPEVYLFTARYSGDTYYAPATSECDATGESVSVPEVEEALTEPTQPMLPPTLPPGGKVGTSVVGISQFKFSPVTFAVARRPDVGKKSRQRFGLGTRVSFVLSGNGTISITVSKIVAGLRFAGRGCVPTAAVTQEARAHHAPCKTSHVVGTIMRSGSTGSNSFYFMGRLGSHMLTAGSYQVTATVRNAPDPPNATSTTFRIMP